jgi:hypothetical protein
MGLPSDVRNLSSTEKSCITAIFHILQRDKGSSGKDMPCRRWKGAQLPDECLDRTTADVLSAAHSLALGILYCYQKLRKYSQSCPQQKKMP